MISNKYYYGVYSMKKTHLFKSILSVSAFLTLLLIFSSFTVASESLVIMTENYPPFNYQEDGNLKGASVEIVQAIIDEIQVSSEIKLFPWARAYQNIQQDNNQVLFSMARTPSREDMFKWVGPLIQYDIYLYKKKGSAFSIQSIEDAKELVVGVKKNTARHTFLKKNGFENIYIDYSSEKFPLPKMLVTGRIDLWPIGKMSASHIAKIADINMNDIEPTIKILSQELYIAFSKTTPKETINKWRNALNTMKSNGRYDSIMNRYLQN